MALNGTETTLIALTDTLQLMSYALKGGTSRSRSEFSVYSHPFHNGAITGLDVCQRKPIVATCGADRSIKVWNYLTLDLEHSCCDNSFFFFTGNYILAGFSDKLRLMNLLIDDIRMFREFPFKNSTACAFSCGGHLLAAVSHNRIAIFSSVDFRNIVSFQFHWKRKYLLKQTP